MLGILIFLAGAAAIALGLRYAVFKVLTSPAVREWLDSDDRRTRY